MPPTIGYSVTLLDERDGFQRTIREPWMTTEDTPDGRESVDFFWCEGNFSCDCARAGVLYPDNDAKHPDCSSEVIRLVSFNWDDGTVTHYDERGIPTTIAVRESKLASGLVEAGPVEISGLFIVNPDPK